MVQRLLIWLFCFLSSCVFTAGGYRKLGCFTISADGLMNNSEDEPGENISNYPEWCVNYCDFKNFTFAALQYPAECACGTSLGSAFRLPFRHCRTVCDDGTMECVQFGTQLVFLLLDEDVEKLSLTELEILLGIACGGFILVAILIHGCRVYRRRSRLLKVYIRHLEKGDFDYKPPPSVLEISNAFCWDTFCCCYPERDLEKLDYEELLKDLDPEPAHDSAVTDRLKNYIKYSRKRCSQDKDNLNKLLKRFSRTGSVPVRPHNSLQKLAQQYALYRRRSKVSQRHSESDQLRGSRSVNKSANANRLFYSAKDNRRPSEMSLSKRSRRKLTPEEIILPKQTMDYYMSSPARLCRRGEGSSGSSLDEAFPWYSSNISIRRTCPSQQFCDEPSRRSSRETRDRELSESSSPHTSRELIRSESPRRRKSSRSPSRPDARRRSSSRDRYIMSEAIDPGASSSPIHPACAVKVLPSFPKDFPVRLRGCRCSPTREQDQERDAVKEENGKVSVDESRSANSSSSRLLPVLSHSRSRDRSDNNCGLFRKSNTFNSHFHDPPCRKCSLPEMTPHKNATAVRTRSRSYDNQSRHKSVKQSHNRVFFSSSGHESD